MIVTVQSRTEPDKCHCKWKHWHFSCSFQSPRMRRDLLSYSRLLRHIRPITTSSGLLRSYHLYFVDRKFLINWHWCTNCMFPSLFPSVLFNMHDTDNDGTITLEEYRKVGTHSCLIFQIGVQVLQPHSTENENNDTMPACKPCTLRWVM